MLHFSLIAASGTSIRPCIFCKLYAPNLQLFHIVVDNLFFSFFEDVTLDAGVEMDGYRSGSALSRGTYTYGSSFTVSYVELAGLKISSLKNVWDCTLYTLYM